MHSHQNLSNDRLDLMQINGSKCIDSMAISIDLLSYIEGSIITETNKITISDHRGYNFNLSLEDYFGTEMSIIEKLNYQFLNPSRASHKKVFVEELKKYLEIFNFEQTFYQRCNSHLTRD